MQIPILNGNYADPNADFRTSYPVNMVPVPKAANGISNGYLRPADGIIQNGTGPGVDRGGINWDGVCYRVMGDHLVSVAQGGAVVNLAFVGGSGPVSLDYSFDYLAIASSGALFYWDGASLVQVTDPDIGNVVDFVWVDGYFMTTDGESLVVTELNNPTSVNPLKYGSSESDPDGIQALLKVRNEVYVVNRYTTEVFDNVGGDLFPFARVEGAQIQKGTVGTHACCVYLDAVAMLGSGRNEAPGVYVGSNANAVKISTREIDQILEGYSDAQLAASKLEARNDKAHTHLYVHLPDVTLVYDSEASAAVGEHVWFFLTTSVNGMGEFRARNMVWAYSKWLVGDPQSSAIGYFDDSVGSHWGERVRWEFGTGITYNEGRGAIFHELELVALPGRVALGDDPRISTSYSIDGETWSQDRFISAGKRGESTKRLVWRSQGMMRNWRIQRFRGDSSSHISFARLEAQLETLAR